MMLKTVAGWDALRIVTLVMVIQGAAAVGNPICWLESPYGVLYNITQAMEAANLTNRVLYTVAKQKEIPKNTYSYSFDLCASVQYAWGNLSVLEPETWESWSAGKYAKTVFVGDPTSAPEPRYLQLFGGGDIGYPCKLKSESEGYGRRSATASLYCNGCPNGGGCISFTLDDQFRAVPDTEDFCICDVLYGRHSPCDVNLLVSIRSLPTLCTS